MTFLIQFDEFDQGLGQGMVVHVFDMSSPVSLLILFRCLYISIASLMMTLSRNFCVLASI
jgi:hypothetical protein